jgi:hypothetical protein
MYNYIKSFFNYGNPKTEKKTIIKNDDYQKYYRHIMLIKELKEFFLYKNSEYLRALLRNQYRNDTKDNKLDFKNYKNIIKK